MCSIFLCGPMGWPPVLERLAGAPVADLNARPAVLQGYALEIGDRQCFATLREGAGHGVKGVAVAGLKAEVKDQIRYVAHAIGYQAVTCQVDVDDQPVEALVFRGGPDLPADGMTWQEPAWARQWGQIAAGAVQEIAGHQGQVKAQDLAPRLPMVLARAAARQNAATGVRAEIRQDTPASAVQSSAVHTRHAGFFLTQEHELRYPGFDGGLSAPVRREVFVATDAAIVLPYDPERDRVLLVEQMRMGPYGRGDPRPWMLEPVAGRVDAGETPEDCAKRECEEEAGLALHRLERIAGYYCTPGYSTEYFHTFLGLCDLPDLKQGSGGLDSEDEDIRTHVLSFEAAMGLVETGEADNGPLILSLIWLARERARLRAAA